MDQPKASNIVWHDGAVSAEQRASCVGQRGVTLWFTGLSGSGKSTVAVELERQLLEKGLMVYRLDGDNIRHGLNANLGFSPEDRKENIRRVSEMSKLFCDACVITLVSFISPYRVDREAARKLHEKAGLLFAEVHVDVPLEVAESRDPKGLYKKARAGEIPEFTGISAPYEAPESPEIHLVNHGRPLSEVVDDLTSWLNTQGILKD